MNQGDPPEGPGAAPRPPSSKRPLELASVAFDRLVDAMAALSGVLIVLMMLGTSIDVLMRYFLNAPIHGLVAFTEFGLLYIAFLAAPWLLRLDYHVRLDFLINSLRTRQRALLGFVTNLLGGVVCVVFVWYGTQEAWELWMRNVYDIFKLQGFPKAIPVAIIPACGLVLLIQFGKLAARDLRRVLHP